MRDDVVQLTGDPQPFVADTPAGLLLAELCGAQHPFLSRIELGPAVEHEQPCGERGRFTETRVSSRPSAGASQRKDT